MRLWMMFLLTLLTFTKGFCQTKANTDSVKIRVENAMDKFENSISIKTENLDAKCEALEKQLDTKFNAVISALQNCKPQSRLDSVAVESALAAFTSQKQRYQKDIKDKVALLYASYGLSSSRGARAVYSGYYYYFELKNYLLFINAVIDNIYSQLIEPLQ
jgi:hypothetical protein